MRPAAPASSSVPSPASSSATVLLVDDEAPIRNSLGPYLERSGHRVLLAGDGVEALDLLGAYDVDIVVTDVLMPRMDGRELVRRLRAGGTWTPIIMLTQLDASYERVSALDDGADDYLSKPFDPAELASRIRAVLRRTRGMSQPLTAAARLVAGDLVLERVSRRVELAGRELNLTPKAVTLLDYLMSHPGELHTRNALLSALWGIDFASSTRAVDHRMQVSARKNLKTRRMMHRTQRSTQRRFCNTCILAFQQLRRHDDQRRILRLISACKRKLERLRFAADNRMKGKLLPALYQAHAAGTLHLIDEALTPDSSRFWPKDSYQPGHNPPSYDKQYVRDHLEAIGWNKQPPAPAPTPPSFAHSSKMSCR